MPESETAVNPVQSAAAVDSAPDLAGTPPAPAESAPPGPPASAPAASASAAPSNPWTTAEDCSRFDTAPEYRDLSAEDRARSRATCDAKEEFRAFVATRQTCSNASDCTNVSGSCPFGCYVPVVKAAAPAVTAKLETLATRLDKAGHRCVYRCTAPPSEACVDGRCTTAPR